MKDPYMIITPVSVPYTSTSMERLGKWWGVTPQDEKWIGRDIDKGHRFVAFKGLVRKSEDLSDKGDLRIMLLSMDDNFMYIFSESPGIFKGILIETKMPLWLFGRHCKKYNSSSLVRKVQGNYVGGTGTYIDYKFI